MARPLFVKNSNTSWAQASDYNINNGSWTKGKLIYVKTDNGWEHEHEYQNFREISAANCVDEQEYVYDCPCYETGAYSNTYYGTVDPNNHKGGYSYVGAVNYNTTYHTKKYKCVACGQAAPAQNSLEAHTASSAWRYDSSKHWHACTAACGAKLNEDDHVAAAEMTWDTSNHWYPCTSNCGVKLSQAAHDYYPPSYGVDINDPDNYHWSQQDCKVCDYTKQIERLPHTPTSSYSPYMDLTHLTTTWCKFCGRYIKENEEEPHTYGENYDDYNEYQHWKKCQQCGEPGEAAYHSAVCEQLSATQHRKGCLSCTYTLIENHDAIRWAFTTEQHWKQCDTCVAGHAAMGYPSVPKITTPVAHDAVYSSYLGQSTTGHHRHTYCTTCSGDIFNGWEDHTPDYSTWLSDDNEHWRKCSGCGYEMDKGTHNPQSYWGFYDGTYHRRYCDDCGWNVETGVHTPSSTWSTDNNYHWHECSAGCGYDMDKGTHSGSWSRVDDNYHHKLCGTCGWVINGNTPHDAVGGWEYSDTWHWKDCSTCNGRLYYNHHSYSSSITTQPGCTTSGVRTYSCECGRSYTSTIPATGHSEPSSWSSNGTHHYKYCANGCGTRVAKAAHSGTYQHDDNWHWKNCDTCGRSMVSKTSHLPGYSGWFKTLGTYHAYTCECGYTWMHEQGTYMLSCDLCDNM